MNWIKEQKHSIAKTLLSLIKDWVTVWIIYEILFIFYIMQSQNIQLTLMSYKKYL